MAGYSGRDGHRLWRRRAAPQGRQFRRHRLLREAGRFRPAEAASGGNKVTAGRVMAARILVVDDEPDVELLLNQRFRRNIRSGEFAFRYARDAEQALQLLQGDPGTVPVLLVINLPVMDGLTMLAR